MPISPQVHSTLRTLIDEERPRIFSMAFASIGKCVVRRHFAQSLRCRACGYRSFAATAAVALPVADGAIDDREQRMRVGRGACARPAPRVGTAPAQLVEEPQPLVVELAAGGDERFRCTCPAELAAVEAIAARRGLRVHAR